MNRLLARLRNPDDGFTLVEALVALVIIFGLMVVLLRTFDSGTRVLVETRRQTAASKLASELIERAQALEWQHMGLAASNNGNDCATEQIGCYVGAPFPDLVDLGGGAYEFAGEEVVFANADTFAPFLSFHSLEDRGGTNFDRYLFVTKIAGMDTARRLTAVVEWIPPGGFRREVRLETIVSEYVEPSQPLIGGEVIYTGGEFAFNHRDPALKDGSGVDGTKGWTFSADPTAVPAPATIDFSNTPRPNILGVVLQPALRATAVSDFVSGTDLQLTSANVAELSWAGVPAAIPLPSSLLRSTDDDASSLPPLNVDPIDLFSATIDGYHYAGTGLEDLVVAETDAGVDLVNISSDPLDKTGTDETGFTAELWTQYLNALPAEDPPLPLVTFGNDLDGAPDEIVVGFTEYESPGFTSPLGAYSRPFYDFRFYRRGNADEAYHLDADLDRENDPVTGERSIAGDLDFFGDEIRLFADDAYNDAISGKNDKFHGFVKIFTPEVTISNVAAGEGVLLPPSLTTNGDLVILIWDPALGPKGDYVEAYRKDYETLTSACDAAGVQDTVGPFFINDGIRSPGHPFIDYYVTGSIEINGWCSQVKNDALGNVSEATIQTNGPMVSGDLRYVATDVRWRQFFMANPGYSAGSWGGYAPGEMTIFDVDAHFETDYLKVTAVFVDPNAG